MTKENLKVLLVMQHVPLESPFLASKFISLAERLDASLMVWDTKERIEEFIRKNKLKDEIAGKIYQGIDTRVNIFSILVKLILLCIVSRKVRALLLSSSATIMQKVKVVAYYLPVFKVQPDIIHFEFGTLAKHLSTLKTLASAKLVTSFRGYDINYAGLEVQSYYDEVWKDIDGLHFLGNDLKERAIKRGYKEDKKEAIIAPAIDVSVFDANGVNKPNDRLVVISVGRLTWKKGYEYGIRAIALLQAKGIPIEYRIIGAGPHLQALQFTIFELGLQDTVKLLGNMSTQEVRQHLDGAHVFLHPAISEGFCNAVIEAQAMTLPVVCTDADGLKENIADGETGFSVGKWDVTAMAGKLEWFWNNKEQITLFGKAGRERVNKYFTQEKQIQAFLQFYNKVHTGV